MTKKPTTDALEDLPPTTCSYLTTEGNETGDWRHQRPVLDQERCNRCGLCWMYCPDNAVRAEGDTFVILYKYCKGCGICAQECPKRAISLIDEER